MRKILVFNSVSLDGFISDTTGDMSWAHKQDAEWNAFVAGNAKGESEFLFGRKTYDMMASFWPTPMAIETLPAVAEAMNGSPKVVFSRTLEKASWNNTRLVKDNLTEEVREMKQSPGPTIVIFGSGTIISQLANEGLIDEYQIVMCPVVLGKGRTMFEGVTETINLHLTKTRAFSNGNVVLDYELLD